MAGTYRVQESGNQWRLVAVLLVMLIHAQFSSSSGAWAQGVTKASLPRILDELKNPNRRVRLSALEELRRLGPDAAPAVPRLVELLTDDDPDVCDDAVWALARIGDPASPAVYRLIRLLKEGNQLDRAFAAEALGRLGAVARPAIPSLVNALGDDEATVRSSAINSLTINDAVPPSAFPRLVELLKDPDLGVQDQAGLAVLMMRNAGGRALPLLSPLLKDKRPYVRHQAALALVQLGRTATPVMPDIARLLTGEANETVLVASQGLKKISDGLFDDAHNLTDDELSDAMSSVERTLQYLETLPSTGDSEDVLEIKGATRSLRAAQTALQSEHQKLFWRRIPRIAKQNPGWAVGAALLCLTWIVTGLMFWLQPLWLLRYNYFLSRLPDLSVKGDKAGWTVAIRYLTLAGFFHHHDRVLDAWVAKHAPRVGKKLSEIPTFQARRVYVGVTVAVGDKTEEPAPTTFQTTFAAKSAAVLLRGEGGSGKTTLAVQMAEWALAELAEQRLCRSHQMIPLFIEENLPGAKPGEAATLLRQIGGRLQSLTGEEAAPADDLVKSLLRSRRVLLIIDGLSERDEATRGAVLTRDPSMPINALLVTSRFEERLGASETVEIVIGKLQGKNIAVFIENYIVQAREKGLGTTGKLYAELAHFEELAKDHEVTALLAGLYARFMMELAENATTGRPHDVPELMDFYVKEMARKGDDPTFTEYYVQRLARKVAWRCLERTLTPTQTAKEAVAAGLLDAEDGISLPKGAADPHAVLDYLIDRLRLLDSRGSDDLSVTFVLDPVAEYLAARYLVAHGFRSDALKWDRFLLDMEERNGASNSAAGFIRALHDVVKTKGSEGPVPPTLLSRLEAAFPQILSSPASTQV